MDVARQKKLIQESVVDIKYAGFIKRAGAGVIDSTILVPFLYALMMYGQKSITSYLIAIALLWFGFGAYEVLMLKHYGATLGKMAMRISVKKIDANKIGWKESILRNIISYVLTIIEYILVIKILMTYSESNTSTTIVTFISKSEDIFYKSIKYLSNVWALSEMIVLLMNDKRRALHDFIAGTVVISDE